MSATVTLRLDTASPVPAYRQIVDGLRLLFVNGALRPGDTLPPIRTLALDLGVHFSTVAEAYRTLSGEGWLELKRRHGATVTERPSPKAAPAARADFGKRLRELIAQVRAEGLSLPVIRNELANVSNELSQ